VITQELPGEQKAAIFNLHKIVGWFVFKETTAEQEDIDLPDLKPAFKGDITAGQRLRAVLYVYWEQNGSKGDFDAYYKKSIENIISQFKE